MPLPYFGEICQHCKGTGYIRRCPKCKSTDVDIYEVPGMWWGWRCKCGWEYRKYYLEPASCYEPAHSKD